MPAKPIKAGPAPNLVMSPTSKLDIALLTPKSNWVPEINITVKEDRYSLQSEHLFTYAPRSFYNADNYERARRRGGDL